MTTMRYMELSEIKLKLEKVIDVLETFPPDTTVSNQKSRRIELGFLDREKGDLIKSVSSYPVEFQTLVSEMLAIFDEYYHYFDLGYQASHGIDELPSLLKGKVVEVVKYEG
jgi:hypothetical protein